MIDQPTNVKECQQKLEREKKSVTSQVINPGCLHPGALVFTLNNRLHKYIHY
jgi:hypothetical protein